MEAKGSTFLKVTGILMIVFGAIVAFRTNRKNFSH